MNQHTAKELEEMEENLRTAIRLRLVPDASIPYLRTALAGVQAALRESPLIIKATEPTWSSKESA
jgi:hypothetical protein